MAKASLENNLTLHQFSEQTALRLMLPVAVVVALLTYFYNRGYETLPFLGLHSVGLPIIFWGGFLSFIFFIYGYRQGLDYQVRVLKLRPLSNFKVWLYSVTLGLVHALLIALLTAVVVVIFKESFIGLELGWISAGLITAGYAAVITYLIINLSMDVTVQSLTTLVVIFFLSGVAITMLTTNQTDWWNHNFSYLGTNVSRGYRVFDLTLILSSLTLVALGEYIFEGVRSSFIKISTVKVDRFNLTKRIFIVASLALGGVGLFTYSFSPLLHNLSAFTLTISFGLMMLGMRALLPCFSKEFYRNSYIIGALLVISWAVLLNATQTINLTGFEFIAGALCGTWLALFLRNLSLKAEEINAIIATKK